MRAVRVGVAHRALARIVSVRFRRVTSALTNARPSAPVVTRRESDPIATSTLSFRTAVVVIVSRTAYTPADAWCSVSWAAGGAAAACADARGAAVVARDEATAPTGSAPAAHAATAATANAKRPEAMVPRSDCDTGVATKRRMRQRLSGGLDGQVGRA